MEENELHLDVLAINGIEVLCVAMED